MMLTFYFIKLKCQPWNKSTSRYSDWRWCYDNLSWQRK